MHGASGAGGKLVVKNRSKLVQYSTTKGEVGQYCPVTAFLK